MNTENISIKKLLSKRGARNIVFTILLLLLMLLFNKLTNNVFTSVRNLTLLMKQGAVLMIVASSLMLLLIERNFDLSGGAAVYFVSVVAATMSVTFKMSLPLVILISLAVGIFMGSINGFFVGYVGVPAFIATLAAQLLFKGVGYTLTNAATIGPIPESLAFLSEGYIPKSISAILISLVALTVITVVFLDYRKMHKWQGGIMYLVKRIVITVFLAVLSIWIFTGYYGIPMCVFFASVIVSLTWFISSKTVLGRHIYIIGGNPDAAFLSGIKTKTRVFQSYLYMGLIYAVAGVVITARLGGSTATSGNLIELDAVAAACIGGTSMSGGVGKIGGVVIGVLILSAVDNVMSLMNVSSYLQMVVKGAILLFAVCMDVYVNRSKFKFLINKNKKRA